METELQLFAEALRGLTEMAGWDKQYFIRAEPMGQALGHWYYLNDDDGKRGFYELLVPADCNPDDLFGSAVFLRGHAVDEQLLTDDIGNGLVNLARVPNRQWHRHIRFSYVY